MRLLNKYVGTLACFISYLAQTFKHKSKYVYPKKILITKFWGIGSIILASPTIRAVREKFPNAKIIFLTLDKNKGLYEDSGLFDEILYFKLDSIPSVFSNFLITVLKLRKQKIDLAIDLDVFAMFTTLLFSLSNIKYKIGHTIGKRGKELLYEKNAVYNNKQHISDSFFDLARLLGIKNKPSIVKIPVSESDKKYVNDLLKKEGIKKNDKIVGMNVNASDFGTARRWPYKNFAETADRIIQAYKLPVIFIGAGSDKELVRKTIESMKNKEAINLSGKTTIKQLACLIQKFKLLITNDSGPMHMAVAMGTPVIAFFGPETPLIYGPLGEKHTVFYKHLPCSPCLNVYNAKKISCKDDARCIVSITVDEVMDKVKRYIK